MGRGIGDIVEGINKIASAITPRNAVGSKDAAGGFVSSLTEALMGHTAGLCQVAESLESIASAISEVAIALRSRGGGS
jgi:hypothetical protein